VEENLDHLKSLADKVQKVSAGTVHGHVDMREALVDAIHTLVEELADLRARLKKLEGGDEANRT
jgi:spore cortex formation protein SpoVR/YcgB (stage V sporulation)